MMAYDWANVLPHGMIEDLVNETGLLTPSEARGKAANLLSAADVAERIAAQTTPKPPCKGFRWLGQSFKHCDGCGRPYWEHTHDAQIKRGSGPFDDDPFEYVPITDEQKAKTKAKWDR